MRAHHLPPMNNPGATPPRHLRVVLLSGLGDVVHGLPVINAMRDAYPDMRVTWVAEPMPAGVLQGHPSIDHIVVYRRAEGVSGVRDLRRQLASLGRPDLTLNFNVYFKSIWPTLLSRGRRRIGFDRERSFEGVWLASNERIPARPRAHTADMFLEFAEYLRLPVADPEWRLELTQAEREQQDEFRLRFAGKPIATVIPASASHKKDWMASRWAEVADSLASDYGFQVVLAGGPGEREGKIAKEIVDRTRTHVEVAMGDSIRRLISIIGASSLVLAPDTGPVHIARALGVPVIGIYGHTNPWRVGPWRAYQDLWIDHYTEFRPDPTNRKPKWEVMHTIESSEVIDKVKVAVENYGVLTAGRLDSTV